MRKLSIIVPVYNEAETVERVIERLEKLDIGTTKKEIVIVDDGSTDGSVLVITNNQLPRTKFELIRHKKNLGKGAAIKTGLKYATGDYVIIQDADLEYHPQEIKKLVSAVKKTNSPVVYGTRNRGIRNKYAYPVMYWGAKILIGMVNLFYGQQLSDPECCYKLVRRKLLDFEISERGFGVEIELTAKLAKKGIKIAEVPIKYFPRTYEQGKKITIWDGARAIWLAIKWAV